MCHLVEVVSVVVVRDIELVCQELRLLSHLLFFTVIEIVRVGSVGVLGTVGAVVPPQVLGRVLHFITVMRLPVLVQAEVERMGHLLEFLAVNDRLFAEKAGWVGPFAVDGMEVALPNEILHFPVGISIQVQVTLAILVVVSRPMTLFVVSTATLSPEMDPLHLHLESLTLAEEAVEMVELELLETTIVI